MISSVNRDGNPSSRSAISARPLKQIMIGSPAKALACKKIRWGARSRHPYDRQGAVQERCAQLEIIDGSRDKDEAIEPCSFA